MIYTAENHKTGLDRFDTNVLSISGGKDSTALLLLALEREAPNMQAVFCDTGNEHQATYDYVRYLTEATGVDIQWIKADFSRQIAGKREFVALKWRQQGVSESVVIRALELLQPTGNPFLDMCIWKGRFPSSKTRFCTQELKVFPIQEQVFEPLLSLPGTQDVYSWQGVRGDESPDRAKLPELDEVGDGLFNYRPLLNWSWADVFRMHSRHGVRPNPLYSQGMGRVGCMPCVNCRKGELKEIGQRFPEVIERIREWESLVSQASKQGSATFFAVVNDPTVIVTDKITPATHGIDRMLEWASTSRGGRQFDLLGGEEVKACSSAYGLCE